MAVVVATLLAALGTDPAAEVRDRGGRPFTQHRTARVAGNQMPQQKRDEQDADQDRNRGDETPR